MRFEMALLVRDDHFLYARRAPNQPARHDDLRVEQPDDGGAGVLRDVHRAPAMLPRSQRRRRKLSCTLPARIANNRMLNAALHPTCNSRSRSGDVANGPAAASQPDGDSPAVICRSATVLSGIASSTPGASCVIGTQTEDMPRGAAAK